MLVLVSLVLVVESLGLVFSNGSALVINAFPQIGGAANAVVGVVRFAVSSIVCSLISLFHTQNLKPIGIGIFLAVFVANILFIFYVQNNAKQKRINLQN